MLEKEHQLLDENRQGEATTLHSDSNSLGKKLYIESYGCAMNFSDSEIVASILTESGFSTTRMEEEADVVLINTCSIRDNAEQKIRYRLNYFNSRKKKNPGLVVGVLGCMAERLKTTLLEQEKIVDLVVGPDAYRDLPLLISEVESGQRAINVLLSREETYADVSPIRLNSNGVNSFVSIMRGCDNMCSFCVVPYTRGRERSRDPETIVHESRYLFEQGYREITLLGQNVDSYRWNITKKGEVIDSNKPTVSFAQLLEKVADISPELRIRFSTSHPKDMVDDVLEAMSRHENICDYIHLPVQSGSSTVLNKMNRGYTREWYLDRIAAIRRILPNCAISTDIITGFCGETDEEHAETVSLMKEVGFEFAYMFKYSERPKTLAERKYEDDIPEEIKQKRLQEVIDVQHINSHKANLKQVGHVFEVLIEGESKKSSEFLQGRTSRNAVVVFAKGNEKIGSFVNVKITSCTSATLLGEVV